ncbi:wall-associated receptor kinase 17-like [Carex rostrata]
MFLKIHLFLLLSFILTSISLSSSTYLSPSALDADSYGNLTCSSIPYPFGTPGNALPGFEIGCPKEKPWINPPILTISKNTYTIQEISLQGYIKIFAGPIHKRCFDANGKLTESDGTGRLNLDGTPFELSYQNNTLTVVGCNNLVSISTQGKNLTVTSGCVMFCDPHGFSGGSCSGLGCCQATLPGNLKSFDFKFKQLNISSSSAASINCSVAFFGQRDDFQSNQSGFLFQDRNFNDTHFYSHNLILLDWAIGNKSCEASRNNIGSFACKNNSYCYDSLSTVGYLCNCREGYTGNPYADDGCTDINECLQLDLYPCVGNCINSPGNYTCSCPKGMTGDGKSGCKRVFPLDVALGAGLGLLFMLVISSFFSYWGLQKRKIVKMRSQFFKQNGGYLLQQRLASQGIDSETKIFTEKELEKATENYSENNILGQGGYGTIYKGTLSNLKVVAIKKSKIEDENQIEQFINEIIILSQINHRNVVKLLGCCLETQVPLLVYEFVPNGTLLHLIHGQNSGYHLAWDSRLRISAEAAGALAYLHSAASFPIIHRDIKSSNILLDKNFTAKVSDFGASRSVPFDKTHLTTLVQGTIGYLDPEYFYTSQLTEKSDVYSFGVVLAELLTGEKPISFDRPEEFHNLAMYFTVAFDEGRLLQVIDPPIESEAGSEELYAIARLTKQCLNTKGEERPAMKEVCLELEALSRMRNQQSQTTGNEEIQQLLVVGNL